MSVEKPDFSLIEPWSIVDLMERELPKAPCWIEPAILPKGGMMLFGGHAKTGKALEASEPVLLPDGTWKPIEELQVGETVASPDGLPSVVLEKVVHESLDLYEMEFKDGRKVVCCGEHLWQVGTCYWPEDRIVNTKTLYDKHGMVYYKNRFCIPVVSGDFGDVRLPIPPYILGALLGDGSFINRTATLSAAEPEIVERFREYFGEDLVPAKKHSYRISDGGWLAGELEAFGLLRHRSYEKFIPEVYFSASKEQRLELLRGLMDTDGYISRGGSVDFCSTSKQMAKDVQRLVWSLGGISTIKEKTPWCTYKDRRFPCRTAYIVRIRRQNLEEFFHLERKRDRAKQHKCPRLVITNIRPVGKGRAVCIGVSHPDRLFVTRDYIVTHNSLLMLELARALALGKKPCDAPALSVPSPTKILMIEQELGPWGVQKRAKKIYAGENLDLLRENFHGISQVRGLKFDNPDSSRIVADWVHRVGAQVLFLDPIGKLHGYDENDASQINRLFHRLEEVLEYCKDLHLSLVFSHHFGKPIRDPRVKLDDDLLFSPYNFRGSGRWYDNPDTLVTCNRIPSDENKMWKWWYIKSRWETRQGGEVPEYQVFSVNKNNDLRVRYEERAFELEPLEKEKKVVVPSEKVTMPEGGYVKGFSGRAKKGFARY